MDRTCEKCGHTFEKRYFLIRHLERKTPCTYDGDTVEGRLSCTACGKTFASASTLSRHRTTCEKVKQRGDFVLFMQQQAGEVDTLKKQVQEITTILRKTQVADESAVAPATPLVFDSQTAQGGALTASVTRTRILTEIEETRIEIRPWDGPDPCINITTEQIVQAFKENPMLQEFMSLHHDEMTDPQKTPDFIVELFMDLMKRGHEALEARNIHLNPSRADQVKVRLRSGVWEVHGLTGASRRLLEAIAKAMKRTALRDEERVALPVDAQEALAWAGLHFNAEPERYVRAAKKPLTAHLTNMIPAARIPLLR